MDQLFSEKMWLNLASIQDIGGLIGHYSFLTADWVMKRGAVENKTNMTACIHQTLSIQERKSIAPMIGRLVNNNVISLLRYLLL
jgi:hypothetical protein